MQALRAAEGVPLEYLIDVLTVYRHVTIELISLPLQGTPRRDEILALAQSRLENVTERLTTSIARGYQDHLDDEHRAREGEMYGLAAIVTAMGRSLDVAETAEAAIVESLAALRLSTGALWLQGEIGVQAASRRRLGSGSGRGLREAGRPTCQSVRRCGGEVGLARRSGLGTAVERRASAASRSWQRRSG